MKMVFLRFLFSRQHNPKKEKQSTNSFVSLSRHIHGLIYLHFNEFNTGGKFPHLNTTTFAQDIMRLKQQYLQARKKCNVLSNTIKIAFKTSWTPASKKHYAAAIFEIYMFRFFKVSFHRLSFCTNDIQ